MSKTKTLTIAMLAGAVAFFAGFMVYTSKAELTAFDIGVAVFVVLIVLGSIPIIRARLKNEKLGLPADDELSEMIKQKAEAKAFGISYYMWAFIAIISMNMNFNPIVPIGIGMFAMGALFMGFWYYYSRNGVGYEDPN